MRIKRLTSDILFESDHLRKDLAQKTVRGGVTTMSAQALQFLLHTGSTMILARLLSPSDYGLVAMVTVITGFLAMFKDAGLNMATIQQENITRDQISTLFWINVIISAGLGLIIFASAPLVGLFYKRPELVPVTAFLSINFALGGLTLQHNALLQRHMMFQARRTILIVSMIIGIIVSIILAYYGFRYWSLVWGTLTSSLVRIALTWFYCNWIPGKMKKGTGVRKMLKFGGHVTAVNFFNYWARNGDNLLIGRFQGAESLGLYTKGYAILILPIQQIRNPVFNVAIPALSRLVNYPQKYAKYYYALCDIITTLTIPIAIYCAIEPGFIVNIFLGKNWLQAIPLVRIFGICGIVHIIATTRGLSLLTLGLSDKYLYQAAAYSLLSVLSFIAGLPFGIKGVAISFTIFNYIYFIPSMIYVFKGTPLSLLVFLRSVYMPLLIGLLAGFVLILSKMIFSLNRSLVGGLLGMVIYLVIYIGLNCLRPRIKNLFLILRTKPAQPEKRAVIYEGK